MCDERDQGEIISGHDFDRCQEFLYLGRCKSRSWLIQDEYFGATIQGFQNLHNLFFPFRKLPDFRLKIKIETVFIAEPGNFFCGSLQVQYISCPWVPEDDVFEHRMGGNQFSILVNHPYPKVNGIQRGFEVNLLAKNENLTFVGLYQPEQDLH